MEGTSDEPKRFASGDHERRLAIGTLALQATQAVSVVAAIGITTLLGRRLSLSEFGTYGLIVAFASVFNFAHVSVEQAAMERLARAAGDERARSDALSVILVAYAVIGAVAGLVIAAATIALPGVLGVPDELQAEARAGGIAVGAIVAVGWPVSATRDVLRAEQLFRRAAIADAVGYVLMAAGTFALVAADGPLWALIAVGGGVLLLQGVVGLWLCVRSRVLPRPARRPPREELRSFARFSGKLLATTATDVVINSLDRVVLSALTSVRQVALYEGAARAHQLVRLTAGSLAGTVLPSAARFRADGDSARTHDLLVRGTRYVLALVVPLVIALCALAEPLLGAWLGERYEPAALALAILVSYWLLNANTVIASGMLVAHGRVGWLARYAWTVASANLACSIALTAAIGLEGVVLGTAIPYLIGTPYFVRSAARFLQVPLGSLAREAWLPAYSTGAVLAAGYAALRLTADVDGLFEVVAAGAGGVVLYWLVYAALWLRPTERRLVGDVAKGMLRA